MQTSLKRNHAQASISNPTQGGPRKIRKTTAGDLVRPAQLISPGPATASISPATDTDFILPPADAQLILPSLFENNGTGGSSFHQVPQARIGRPFNTPQDMSVNPDTLNSNTILQSFDVDFGELDPDALEQTFDVNFCSLDPNALPFVDFNTPILHDASRRNFNHT